MISSENSCTTNIEDYVLINIDWMLLLAITFGVIKIVVPDVADTMFKYKSDVLPDLVPFVQFEKREKYPWRIVTFL